jgi:prepilin-type N-terminal cleavage/methylation domain-containing protein
MSHWPFVGLHRSGFTMVEMLIVVTLIGLIAGIALPNVDYTRFRVDAAMRGVGTALVGAQRFAVTRQHDVVVLFDESNNTVRIHDDVNNNQQQDAGERIRGVSLGDQIVLGRGPATAHTVGGGPVTFIKRVSGLPALTFHRNGAASEYGGFYLTSRRSLQSAAAATDGRLVMVERATGRISWYRFNGSTWTEGF